MVDSSGGSKGGASPLGSKFFQSHAVFGKIWQNRMLAPPRIFLGEILDPPLDSDQILRVRIAVQWRIKDFPVFLGGGATTFKVGVLTYFFGRKLHEKLKNLDPQGVRVPGVPLDPPALSVIVPSNQEAIQVGRGRGGGATVCGWGRGVGSHTSREWFSSE